MHLQRDDAPPLVLASASATRRRLLEAAGLRFAQTPSRIDEGVVREAMLGEGALDAEDLARVLAQAKAEDISGAEPGALVIGCDQTLARDGEVLNKPSDMEAARRQLLALRGKPHTLYSAAVLVRDGEVLWEHTARADLVMRDYSPAFVGRYLAAAGDAALSSVGAYQLEGLGAQLFAHVEGDFFTVLGLPLLPLLEALRNEGVLDT